jgi:hypothetical protein
MRVALSALMLAGSIGSCAFLTEEGFQPVRHNVRLTANVTYVSNVDIEGPVGVADSDLDEEMYQLALEFEDADGFAPYIQFGRGSWTFDWPGEIDLLRYSAGARWYTENLGDTGSWFEGTRAFGDLGLSLIDPDKILDASDLHSYNTGFSVNFGTGLQRTFKEDLFFELGLLASIGVIDETVKNTTTSVTAENDWDFYNLSLVIGIGRRF